MTAAQAAVTASVIQKACQTPSGPMAQSSTRAAGMRMTPQRRAEMAKEGPPMPSPSRAPQEMTDTAETRKPRLMIYRARAPAATVAGEREKSPASSPGTAQHTTVPAAMIAPAIARATR